MDKACARCGEAFYRTKGLSCAQWDGRKYCSKRCSGFRREADDSQIVAAYNSGQSSTEIASKIGISAVSVRRAIKNAGGEIRSMSAALRISHSRPEFRMGCRIRSLGRRHGEAAKDKLRARTGPKHHGWKGGITTDVAGYQVFTSSPENGENAGRHVHRVIAEGKIGRRLETHEHVHHKDFNKKNNHPRNLLVMSATDHHRLHAIASGFGRRKQNAE